MSWLALVVASTLGGLVIYWAVGGYYHLRYYVRRKHEPETWKCQPKRWLTAAQQKDAMLKSTANLTLAGLITGSLIYALTRDLVPMPVYYEVADWGWAYTLASTLLLFVVIDALAYYVHRGFHQKWMFRHFHRHHHKYVATTPFVVVAMHPVEFLALQAATFVPLFILPLHYLSIVAVFVYVFVFNIIDHSGVKLSSALPWQGPSTFHDDHHAHFHCNFGQHLSWFDRFHGTMRRQNRRYGSEVFGGKGEAVESAGDTLPDFVRYE